MARKLSRNLGILVLSEDDLLSSLYPGEIVDIPTYVKLSDRLKLAIEGMVVDLLTHGTSIILDFPANTVAQRAWLFGLAERANALHELYYIELPDSTCKTQLLKRAAENPERASTDTIEMFDAISKYFEPPTAQEGLNILRVESGNI